MSATRLRQRRLSRAAYVIVADCRGRGFGEHVLILDRKSRALIIWTAGFVRLTKVEILSSDLCSASMVSRTVSATYCRRTCIADTDMSTLSAVLQHWSPPLSRSLFHHVGHRRSQDLGHPHGWVLSSARSGNAIPAQDGEVRQHKRPEA